MAVGASLVGSWFGQALRGAAVEVGQVAAGRVVEWLGEQRHGSYGLAVLGEVGMFWHGSFWFGSQGESQQGESWRGPVR